MTFIEMSDYTRAARIYWRSTVILGAAALGSAIPGVLRLGLADLLGVAAVMGAVIIAGLRPIRIPGTHASITPGDIFVFLSVLLWGVSIATLIAATDAFAASSRTTKRWASRLVSAAVVGISVFISASLFELALDWLEGARLLNTSSLLAALLLFSITHFLINSLLTAVHYALRKRVGVFDLWWTNYSVASLTYVASASAAGLIYLAISQYGVASLIAAGPLVAIVFATCHFHFKHADERAKGSERMSRMHLATVEALATAIDAKDQITHDHVYRVQVYATGLARHFGLGEPEIEALKAGALLHDVGKIAVPDYILNKPGKLSAAEFEKMKFHTVVGAQIMERINSPFPVVPIVRHHHERWDGKGYPDGLKGDQIPLTARILTVADCFDAVREDRQYRKGMSRDQACAFLLDNAGSQFDPEVVAAFLEELPKFEAEIAAHKSTQEPLLSPTTQQGLSESALEAVPAAGLATTTSEPLDYVKQIHASHAEVSALYEMAQTFSASLDVRDVVTLTVNRIERMIPFTTCVVYLKQQESEVAVATYAFGQNAERIRGQAVTAGRGIAGWVIINSREMNNTDPMLDLAEIPGAGETGYRTAAVYPLMNGKESIGAVALYSSELESYGSHHLHLLESVARLFSTALQHAILYEQTRHLAKTDALTGLPNGRALYAEFDQHIADARDHHVPLTVILFNIAGMRVINNAYGYQTGDRVLAAVAEHLRRVAGDSNYVARIAGDEFICLSRSQPKQAIELARYAQATTPSLKVEVRPNRSATVNISFGSAAFPTDGKSIDELLNVAAVMARLNRTSHLEPGTDYPQPTTDEHECEPLAAV